jgi:hypothetical protein
MSFRICRFGGTILPTRFMVKTYWAMQGLSAMGSTEPMSRTGYQGRMQNIAFMETLDQWLATQGCAPAEEAGDGIVQFDTREGSALAARQLHNGRVEIFSSPGYLDEEMLRTIIEDPDEDSVAADEPGLVPLLAWRDEQAEWQVDVQLADGLAVLTCTGRTPDVAHEWGYCVETFERAQEGWSAKLSPAQAEFDDLLHHEAEASARSSTELLRI